VSSAPLPYRDFYYPLNVFMHILTHEEGAVSYLHYGIFDAPDDSLATAQERSTELLLSRLPAHPARLLEVGIGLGTTLQKLTTMGYDVEGITPDDKQVAMVRERYGDTVRARCIAFEQFTSPQPFDMVLFQESSQYIDSNTLFAKAAELTHHVLVIDEFAVDPPAGAALHRYDAFLAAASQYGFRKMEEVDLSQQAPPTVDYFMARIPRYREALIKDLGLTGQQVDDLLVSGRDYVELYRRGVYIYRLLRFER
jgi:hypothetical protein